MPAARATKRRKLDNDAPPLQIDNEGPEQPANGDISSANITGQAPTVSTEMIIQPSSSSSIPQGRKRTRRSDAAEGLNHNANGKQIDNGTEQVLEKAMDAQDQPTTGINGSARKSTPRRQSGYASKEQGQHETAEAGITGQPTTTQDVEMEDAPSITVAPSQEGSNDGETLRTSSRKRQKSKKLEEAEESGKVSARGSPAVRKDGTAPPQTPSGRSAASRGSARKPTSRKTRGSTTKDTVQRDEVPDSEPETDKPKRRMARANVTKDKSPDVESEVAEIETEPKSEVAQRQATPPTEISVPDVASNMALNGHTTPQKKPAARHKSNSVVTTPLKKSIAAERGAAATTPLKTVAADGLDLLSTSSAPYTPQKRDKVSEVPAKSADVVASDGIAVGNKTASTSSSIDDHMYETDELQLFQAALMARITRRSPQNLVALDAETRKVANLVEQTITAGESNSMVVIGARGSGKTTMLNNIIRGHSEQHSGDFHVVRLSGFIHTDDKIAIREIWRQLGREMELDEDSQVKNYADTMTILLALLSHPSETGQAEPGQMAKSVIIILDEFDLFTTHPRQTLLYNLFDIAQSRKAPIAVIGLTTRFDVAESLEKRVKSRFSHRQVYLPLAKNFASYKEMTKSCLMLEQSEMKSSKSGTTLDLQLWNSLVASALDTSTIINNHLQSLYNTTKSIPNFQSSFILPISTLPTNSPLTSTQLITHIENSILRAPNLSPPDSNLTLLSSLSSLELALLICAARLTIILDTETSSFPLAYDEYKSLASKARIAASAAGALATGSGARVWGAGVARLAWEGLSEKGLIVPVTERGRGAGAMFRVDVSLEEIGILIESALLDGAGMVKWCKEI